MNRPAEKRSWSWYKKHFITKERITKGVLFWKKNKKVLDIANRRYGVPPSIIVSIIGVETMYGEKKGTFKILNTLGTLAFYYSPRKKFFQEELASYIAIAKENHWNNIRSSYAGAFGIPQFMPDTYMNYAVSYSHTKTPDLIHNDNDAILSIANFLSHKGWEKNEPVLIQENTTNIKKRKNTNQKKTALKIVDNHTIYYRIPLPNFYCIMHYNHSFNYAMAVYTLSQKLQHETHYESKTV